MYRRERSLSNCRRASPVSSSKAANMTELRVVGELADDSKPCVGNAQKVVKIPIKELLLTVAGHGGNCCLQA